MNNIEHKSFQLVERKDTAMSNWIILAQQLCQCELFRSFHSFLDLHQMIPRGRALGVLDVEYTLVATEDQNK